MKIGIIGLSLSHPFTYADILDAKKIGVSYVWDYEKDRGTKFAEKHHAVLVENPEEMISHGVDGVIFCGIANERVQQALPFLKAKIPSFINKPMVTNTQDLEILSEAVKETGTPVYSASSIRYSPAFQAISQIVKSGSLGTLLSASSTVCHTIDFYMVPPSTWQDNPAIGGGSIINMGIHAMELIFLVMGTGVDSVHCYASKRHFTQSQSEDTAVITLRYKDGRLGTVNIICASKSSGYDLSVMGTEKSVQGSCPSDLVRISHAESLGDPDFYLENGYDPSISQFLDMVKSGKEPIPFEETCEIYKALIAARKSAESGLEIKI